MYKKGTVVLVPFPFTNLSGNKVRPALIISHGKIGEDIIVVFITSQAKTQEKFMVPVLPDNENGLKAASQIVCSKIATLDSKIILGELGNISPKKQKTIDATLRNVLGL